jgi:Rrf2 family protein
MLSMKAKYALKALTALAGNNGRQMSAWAIASEANIPPKFLEAIMTELRTRGIVNSRRGASGGFTLARDAREIMAGDIIRLVDGPLAPIRCASVTAYQRCEDCPSEERCTLHDMMKDVRSALSSVLDRRSIYDLARKESKAAKKIKNTGPRRAVRKSKA